MRWHYEIESNEQFITCEIRYKSKVLYLDTRHSHMGITRDKSLPFSIFGEEDVTLTVHTTELSYSGEYCCKVTVDSTKGIHREEMCTNLFVYGMIFIHNRYVL
jgi:hypothetical protein